MEVRIKRGKSYAKVYAFDIESHADEESLTKKETSMWLGCLIDENSTVDDESIYTYTMEGFIDQLREKSRKLQKHSQNKTNGNMLIYIYNLSFEWSFILPVLIAQGFKFGPTKTMDNSYETVSTKSASSVWEARIRFDDKHGTVIFRDLSKIYKGGLATVAKSFNLPTQKGEIDYRLNRLHGHIVTKEEKEYCFKDVKILMDILEIVNKKDDKDFWKSTSAASYAMRALIKTGYGKYTNPMKAYRKDYPLLSKEENEFLRKSVSGGICYATPRWQFKVIDQPILHIDAHQMHPSQAYEHQFPYGVGKYFIGKPTNYGISCCRIRISYTDVKIHSVIQLIGNEFADNYELTVWNFEIPTMYKCYNNLTIEYIDGYYYKTKQLPWREFYANNYRDRLVAKKNKDAYGTMYYKLLNNSSYGKLLEKPHNEVVANIIDENGIINSNIIPKDEEDIRNEAKYTYLPVGSCIPAYSRIDLVETALKFGWENIIYFDTDSIFTLYNEEAERVWSTINQTDFLGGWGLEEISQRGQFTAPKRYKLECDGKATIKAGGINFDKYIDDMIEETNNEDYEVSFDEINLISSTYEVKRAFRCKGGTLVDYQIKKVEVQKKYESILKNNVDE